MPTVFRYLAAAWLVIVGASISSPSFALTAAEIDGDVDAALASLYGQSPEAKELADTAKGILVFPKILKAGFIVGGQGGEGALRVDGATAGYYNTVSGSFGLQAGVQTFGYAMFFVNDEALGFLDRSSGWEVGTGPSVTIVDEGIAKSLSTTTLQDDVYVFFFDQAGLMAGLGLQGSKITKFTPEE